MNWTYGPFLGANELENWTKFIWKRTFTALLITDLKDRKDPKILKQLTSSLQLCEELDQVVLRTELRTDFRVVDDVVAEIAPPWLVERREPNAAGVAVAGDAELFQVVQFLHHTWKNFLLFSDFVFEIGTIKEIR